MWISGAAALWSNGPPMGWVFDLDGVLWLGDEPIAGSADAVAEVRNRGEEILFVTNNSYVPLGAYEDKLEAMGVPAEGQVVSSATVGAALVEAGESVLAVGGPGIVQAVEARGASVVGEAPADAVVVGIDRDFDYDVLSRAVTAVLGGARFIATNDDPTYPTPEGPLPGGGAIVAAVAAASGVDPVIAGKPHQPMVDLVRSRLGATGVMVGDRPSTDGLFAVELGYDFGLVLSGVVGPDDLPVQPAPTHTGTDLADLVARWPWPD